jgi:hypothetical protein
VTLYLKNVVDDSFYVQTLAIGVGAYETTITELGELTHDGQGRPTRDIGDDVWLRETMSEQAALAAHSEALERARTRNFNHPMEVAS